ncbi:MAG: bifunctional isocitrate dehydrogenase kinase/phosphatase [Bacteroidota bacterium]
MFEKLIPYDAAYIIVQSYLQYYHNFKQITKRAKIRFELKDWEGIQDDSNLRTQIYRNSVGKTTQRVIEFLGDNVSNQEIWREIKDYYFSEITNFNTRNIAETYYNSIFRHTFRGKVSVDEQLMFVHGTGSYREFRSMIPTYHTFFLSPPLDHFIRQIFIWYQFDIPYEDTERDITYIVNALKENLFTENTNYRNTRLEVLKSVFYRNKGAYIVGRIFLQDRFHPFVIPILHGKNGLYADTTLLAYNDVSSIFSYNRSYFLVDTDIASEKVDFLGSILPTKSLSELYNSIGFIKHGKTVLYRDILRHLRQSTEKFDFAPGIKGMVMIVFTLPTYGMVFKVIRDKFKPPKKVTQREVVEKYELVSQHDRVGRMADSHFFQGMIFDIDRFSDELLQELKDDAPSKIKIENGTIQIMHMYVEKKMVPLNEYLKTANEKEAEDAINEYGRAIKQMAAVNIFPGDMLLKNFGVTRLRRVVFYDYDEIGFLTDYKFRRIPEPRDFDDEMSSEPWYSVGPNDVFPEEFLKFLIGKRTSRNFFLKYHADLLDVKFWIDRQKQLRSGELVDVFPYKKDLRFKNKYAPGGQLEDNLFHL